MNRGKKGGVTVAALTKRKYVRAPWTASASASASASVPLPPPVPRLCERPRPLGPADPENPRARVHFIEHLGGLARYWLKLDRVAKRQPAALRLKTMLQEDVPPAILGARMSARYDDARSPLAGLERHVAELTFALYLAAAEEGSLVPDRVVAKARAMSLRLSPPIMDVVVQRREPVLLFALMEDNYMPPLSALECSTGARPSALGARGTVTAGIPERSLFTLLRHPPTARRALQPLAMFFTVWRELPWGDRTRLAGECTRILAEELGWAQGARAVALREALRDLEIMALVAHAGYVPSPDVVAQLIAAGCLCEWDVSDLLLYVALVAYSADEIAAVVRDSNFEGAQWTIAHRARAAARGPAFVRALADSPVFQRAGIDVGADAAAALVDIDRFRRLLFGGEAGEGEDTMTPTRYYTNPHALPALVDAGCGFMRAPAAS